MLIEFSVANFRSIKEKQTLSMVAASMPEHKATHTFASGIKAAPDLLHSCVIYGPNATGKSNLVSAMQFMKSAVINSAVNTQEGQDINIVPFLFNEDCRNGASEFEVIFIKDKVRYQYGFTAVKERIISEWLYAFPEGRVQKWFDRDWDPVAKEYKWQFGRFLGRKQVWRGATRSIALFFSTAIHLNNEQLKPVFDWFLSGLIVVTANQFFDIKHFIPRLEDVTQKDIILKILKVADINIKDIVLKKEKGLEKTFTVVPDQVPVMDSSKEVDIYSVNFLHKPDNGVEAEIPLDQESDGTKKLFAMAMPLLDILRNGTVLVIDELETHLHPLITRFLFRSFNRAKANRNNAQLVCTTHDTSLLDKDILRRDQVWFMEKNEGEESRLYPLSDFSPRNEEALEKGYLKGRYGALPFVGELNI